MHCMINVLTSSFTHLKHSARANISFQQRWIIKGKWRQTIKFKMNRYVLIKFLLAFGMKQWKRSPKTWKASHPERDARCSDVVGNKTEKRDTDWCLEHRPWKLLNSSKVQVKLLKKSPFFHTISIFKRCMTIIKPTKQSDSSEDRYSCARKIM